MKNGELGWPEEQVQRDQAGVIRFGLAVGVELRGRSVIIVGPDRAAINQCAEMLGITFNPDQVRGGSVSITRSFIDRQIAEVKP
jgi:hypothetical protein